MKASHPSLLITKNTIYTDVLETCLNRYFSVSLRSAEEKDNQRFALMRQCNRYFLSAYLSYSHQFPVMAILLRLETLSLRLNNQFPIRVYEWKVYNEERTREQTAEFSQHQLRPFFPWPECKCKFHFFFLLPLLLQKISTYDLNSNNVYH